MSDLSNLPNLPDISDLDLNLTDLEDLGISEDSLGENFFEEIKEEPRTVPPVPAISSPNIQESMAQNSGSLDDLLDEDFMISGDFPDEDDEYSSADDMSGEINFDSIDSELDDIFDSGFKTETKPSAPTLAPPVQVKTPPIEEQKTDVVGTPSADNAAVDEMDDMDLIMSALEEDELMSSASNPEPEQGSISEEMSETTDDDVDSDKINPADVLANGPSWIKEMQMKRLAAVSHAFMLDFNIKDYVYKRFTLEELLTENGILGTFDMILKYDLANGLQFLGQDKEETRQRFLNATGLNEKKKSLEQNELYQALNDTPEETDNEPVIPDSPLDFFSLVTPLFKQPSEYETRGNKNDGKVLLYIDTIEMILPDAPAAQMQLNDRKLMMLLEDMSSSSEVDYYSNCIVMTANNGQEIHNDLRRSSNRIEKVSIPLPGKEERLAFIEEILIGQQNMGNLFTESFTPSSLSNLSAGLSRVQIEDIAFRANTENTIITEKLVRDRKTDIIKTEYEDVIEIIDSNISFADIGGMDRIKKYFIEEVITPIKSGEDELWMVPLGVMFLGPAGTGKTFLAQAVARESQMNCVNLNIAKILNKYVGASEKNFEKALQCISSMEPTIVIVEEIDNVFAGRGTDSSGVGGRLFKRFLEFMSDTTRRGKVIVIATSNYPSRMDAALKRPGRFDKKIPFLVPEIGERLAIMNVLATRKGFPFEVASIEDMKKLATKEEKQKIVTLLRTTEGMTGAEIETIIQKAITYAHKEKRSIVSVADVFRASEVVIPSTSAIMEMTKEALIECNDLDFIPEKYREYSKHLKESLIQKIPEIEPGSISGNG